MGFRMMDDNAVENIQNQYAAAQYDSSESSCSDGSGCSDKEHQHLKKQLKENPNFNMIKQKSLNQRQDNTKMVGNPCYQVFSAIDY